MGISPFQFIAPDSVSGVLSHLEQRGAVTKVLAGGTDLMPSLKQGLVRPEVLLSLQKVKELEGIEFAEEHGLRLGPLTKLHALETDRTVAERYPLIRQAAKTVAAPQLRQMGTVGGNLLLDTRCCYYNQSAFWRSCRPTCLKVGGETCNAVGGGHRCFAVFSGDVAPALLALGASVTIGSARETRSMPLHDLYSGDGISPFRLAADEILLSIDVPPPPMGAWSAYFKHRNRKSIDFPLASVAAVFVLDPKDKTCRRARLALSGVSTRPIEVEGVQELLQGKRLDAALAEEAASLASGQVKPVENLLGSSRKQRKHMVHAFVGKAIRQALETLEPTHSLQRKAKS